MPILIDAGVVFAGAAVLLCLARIIQKWSWVKMLMIMCSILIAVLFGDYVTVETVQSAWPNCHCGLDLVCDSDCGAD